MQSSGRWADWLALLAGTAVVFSHFWHGLLGVGMAALFLTGVLIAFLACLSIIHPELFVNEAVMVAAGGLMIAVPWLFGFPTNIGAAVTAWAVGGIAVLTGLATLPAAISLYRRIVPPQPMSRRASSTAGSS